MKAISVVLRPYPYRVGSADDACFRISTANETDIKMAYRSGHRSGNAFLTGVVASLFGNRFQDLRKVFSRRFFQIVSDTVV